MLKMWFEMPTKNHREWEREKETDKEWTGLDGVVTHTDCYIHIYNRVRSDRLHLNLHLFYSFCLSLFSFFLALFLSRLVSCSIFSLPLIGHRGAYLPSDWTRTLSLLLALPLSLLFPIMPMVGEQELRVCPIIVWAINQSWRAQATWKETSVADINRTPPTTHHPSLSLSLSPSPPLSTPRALFSFQQTKTDWQDGGLDINQTTPWNHLFLLIINKFHSSHWTDARIFALLFLLLLLARSRSLSRF